MIADMISKIELHPIVTDWLIRCQKLNIYLVFIAQSCFSVPKDVRLNTTHFFDLKVPNRQDPLQVAINYSSDIDFEEFKRLYKTCTANSMLPSRQIIYFIFKRICYSQYKEQS